MRPCSDLLILSMLMAAAANRREHMLKIMKTFGLEPKMSMLMLTVITL